MSRFEDLSLLLVYFKPQYYRVYLAGLQLLKHSSRSNAPPQNSSIVELTSHQTVWQSSSSKIDLYVIMKTYLGVQKNISFLPRPELDGASVGPPRSYCQHVPKCIADSSFSCVHRKNRSRSWPGIVKRHAGMWCSLAGSYDGRQSSQYWCIHHCVYSHFLFPSTLCSV